MHESNDEQLEYIAYILVADGLSDSAKYFRAT